MGISKTDLVFSDMFSGIMIISNLITLLFAGKIVKEKIKTDGLG